MSRPPNRADPVCGTCRRKSRKCDRTKPQCHRCLSKGLLCEGYETKFKVYEPKPKAKQRQQETTIAPLEASVEHVEHIIQSPPRAVFAQTGASPAASYLVTPPSFTSPAGASQSPPSVPYSAQDAMSEDDEESHFVPRQAVSKTDARALLAHFESVLSDSIWALPGSSDNPLKTYMLPLAYEHSSLLHGILGFTACHIPSAIMSSGPTVAIEHKLLAIQSLSSLLIKEDCLGLTKVEEDVALSIVLLLLLQDICESGMSSHGAHLNGVTFLCSRITNDHEMQTPFRKFLLSALSWFDLLRGISGAEKLAFPPKVRKYVASGSDFILESLTGCPKVVFNLLGQVVYSGKNWLAGNMTLEDFQMTLEDTQSSLENYNPWTQTYPSSDPGWPLLADAWRHVALLRVARFPDSFLLPCSDPNISASVSRILDISAELGWDSPFYRRLVFPLFMAGVDADAKHQQHYVRICLQKITEATGFRQPALLNLLITVWQARAESDGTRNVPWMEWTCSKALKRQHDYIFF